MTVEQAKIEFIAAMKRAKLLVSTVPWCCPVHAAAATMLLDAYSASKNLALADHRAGKLSDSAFADLISAGAGLISEFSDSMERNNFTAVLPDGLKVNMPMAVGAQ